MYKNRAKDSRRVFQNPISHVKVIDPSEQGYQANRRGLAKHNKSKLDAQGLTDKEREARAKEDVADTKDYNDYQAGGRPLKIRS